MMEGGLTFAAVGIDIGTTSVKSIICDTKSTRIFQSVVCKIEHTVVEPTCGFKSAPQHNGEQSIQQIISSIVKNLINMMRTQELKQIDKCNENLNLEVSKLTICGQMHGVILWAKDASLEISPAGEWKLTGTTISNLFTWQDRRCTDEFISSLPPSCVPIYAGYGCATLFWLQKYHSEELSRFDCAGTVMDFIVFLLCKLEKPIISNHNAFSWGYFIPSDNQWQCQLLAENGFPIRLLPKIVPAGSVVGRTNFDVCGIIPSNTEVHVAAGDAQCSIASTMIKPHQVVLNLGTSCQLSTLQLSTSRPAPSPHVQVWPYYGDLQLQVAASMNGGNVLEALVSTIKDWMQVLGIDICERTIWSKLTSINPSDLKEYDQNLTVSPTINKERVSEVFTGATISGLSYSTLSLDTLYTCTCIGLVRNIERMFPVSTLQESGISEVICTGSLFLTHPIFYAVVKYIYSGMSVKTIADVDAAYGSVLLALLSSSDALSNTL